MARDEEKKGNKLIGCLLWGVLILVIIVVAVLFMFRGEIKGLAEAAKTAQSAQQLMEQDIPSLRNEFPFDKKSPPAFDAQLFGRYCQARQEMADPVAVLLTRMGDVRSLRGLERNPRAVLKKFGDLGDNIRDVLNAMAPALRRAQMSPETFQWVATQTWGQIAEAAIRGDYDAVAAIQNLRDTASELGVNSKIRDADTQQFAEGLLDHLGSRYELSGSSQAWGVVQGQWSQWNGAPEAALIDMGFAEYLERMLKEFKKLTQK